LFIKRLNGFAFTAKEKVKRQLALFAKAVIYSISVIKPFIIVCKVPVGGPGG
jgi:hypothetical protein